VQCLTDFTAFKDDGSEESSETEESDLDLLKKSLIIDNQLARKIENNA